MFDLTSIQPIVKDGTTVITSPVRLVSSSIFSRQTDGDFASNKYEVTIAFDKEESPELYKAIVEAFHQAEETGKVNLWGGKVPSDLHYCLRAKAEYDDKGNALESNTYYLTARSDFEPKHFDASRKRLTSENEFFPGCYVRIQVEFYPWHRTNEEKSGISASLHVVQKLPSPSANVDMDDFFIPEVEELQPRTPSPEDRLGDDGAELPF